MRSVWFWFDVATAGENGSDDVPINTAGHPGELRQFQPEAGGVE
jgi:hypothetical protein